MAITYTMVFITLALCGTNLPAQAAATEKVIELADDAELDWTAGSVLGLQRSFTIHKAGGSQKAKAAPAARAAPAAKTVPSGTAPITEASVLGFQRSTQLTKVAPLTEEAAEVEVAGAVDPALRRTSIVRSQVASSKRPS
mmetsp:Transcript_31895/g.67816  ORF Transcript_31895/g.67816 Transcript_31895/m.67816 type:complete len:140 (+) Transcript_31895:88-507(+)